MDIASGKKSFKNPKSAFVRTKSGAHRTNRTLPVGLNQLE